MEAPEVGLPVGREVRGESLRELVLEAGHDDPDLPAGLDEAFRLVEPRGTIIMKSTFHGPAQFDTARLVVDEITLLGSRCGLFGRALEMLAQKRVQVEPLISKTFPLEEGVAAFEFVRKTSPLKVLLRIAPA